MDMGSLLGTMLASIPNDKRDPNVYSYGSLSTANIDYYGVLPAATGASLHTPNSLSVYG